MAPRLKDVIGILQYTGVLDRLRSSAGVTRLRSDGASSTGEQEGGGVERSGEKEGQGKEADGLEDDWARPAVCPCDVIGVLSDNVNPFPAVGDLSDIMNEQGKKGPSTTLIELLEADVTFDRPTADDDMAREFGVDSKASCHPWPYKEISPDDLLSSIRKDMRQGWAREALERGIQSMKAGKSPQALAHFDNAIKLDRYCHDAYTAKGAALANNGKLMQAIKCFQDALDINSDDSNARRYLATIKSKIRLSSGQGAKPSELKDNYANKTRGSDASAQGKKDESDYDIPSSISKGKRHRETSSDEGSGSDTKSRERKKKKKKSKKKKEKRAKEKKKSKKY